MKKNPGIAALLSFIIPGAGLIYCESIVRGIVLFLVFCLLVWNSLPEIGFQWAIWFRLIAFALWIYAIITSKRTADRWNDDHK